MILAWLRNFWGPILLSLLDLLLLIVSIVSREQHLWTLGAFSIFVLLAWLVKSVDWDDAKRRVENQKEAEVLERRAREEADKTEPVWNQARFKLEAYFDRNLHQVRLIFYVSIFVMVVGFGFVSYGITRAIADPKNLAAPYVAVISGIVTEFISATYMVVYRSTMAQAATFVTVLERINAVGMAIRILDSIPEQQVDLKNATRSELVKVLVLGHPQAILESPNRTKAKAANASSD